MKNFNYLILLLFIGNSFMLNAQSGKQKKADKLYNNFAYSEAVDYYKELIAKDYNTAYNQRQLGDTYMKLRDPGDAVVYYADVVKQDSVSPEYYYKYAQALRGVKRYDESRDWLEKYQQSGGNLGDVNKILNTNISDLKVKDEYRLKNVDFNSQYSDFGAYSKDGNLYIVSAREFEGKNGKTYKWTGEPFLDVYKVSGNTLSPLSGDVNTPLHDGPITITNDGKYMYFTRNNYLGNKEGKKGKDKTNNLKIYRATNNSGSWTDIVELPFNNMNYSVGHPSISPNGKTLYFASDMPGGQGGTDLYKVSILGDNTYGTPENLGAKINTSEEESFPFIANDSTLYFSSNGHGGFGLLDIFKTNLNDDSGKVTNLGSPVNSNLDDFSYFIEPGTNTGYFSSNREGGMGSDDIYGFNLLKILTLKGEVTDAVNGNPISNATVRLLDENQEQIAFLETDSSGNYHVEINRNKTYPIEAKHIEYQTKNGTIDSNNMDNKEELVYNIQLDPVEDVEYLAEINNIYFDFDKSNIRPDAAKELDKLVDLMTNKYPDLVIEIGSYTDQRGSDKYNEGLSERRANSTYKYLVAHGISADRIVKHQGYGETNPAVECDHCTSEQYQLNRRSMFKVVKMK